MNPISWTKKFRNVSLSHLIVMAAFYHVLSLIVMFVGSFAVIEILSDYEAPYFPVSVMMTLTSGPIEEILFFGLAYYMVGTPHAVLFTGVLWSVAHIFNTQVFQLNTLAYVNFLITIPHIFFSLRVWISGKGWFAILFHSLWNLGVLFWYCLWGLRECNVIGVGEYFILDMLAIGLMCSLISILVILHKKHQLSKVMFRYLLGGSFAVFIIFEVMINLQYIMLFF